MMKKIISNICFLMILLTFQVSQAQAQTDFAGFTYQGFLKDGNLPANGSYQMKFEFFDAPGGGTSFGSNTFGNITVVNGIFTVVMTGTTSFMSPGRSLWIETSVRPADGSSPFTTLAGRQRIYSAPFAISSLLSYDSQRLGGIEASEYVTTTSGATTFIQNGTTQQTGGFNLNGTGTADIFNAATQFNLGGNRILSAGGADNIFAGFGAGDTNTSGSSNSFFGVLAGNLNTTGIFNSFFGRTTGRNNTTGNANSFFGTSAGLNNSSGGSNSFFGIDAGISNTTGTGNTIIGGGANVGAANLTNATALGYRAYVTQSNALVLGGVGGVNGASADTNVGIGLTNPTQRLQVVGNAVFSGNLGIGLTNPTFKLQVNDSSNTGLRVVTNTAGGTVASFGGFGAFQVDAPGTAGGRFTILENGNSGFGTNNPAARLNVVGGGFGANLFVTDSNVTATTFDLGNTSVGGRTWRFQSMGSGDGIRVGGLELWNVGGNFAFAVAPNGNVGFGTFLPQSRVHVAGGLTVNGGINYFDTVGNANFYMKGAGAANGINFGVVGNAGSNSTLYISQYDGTSYQDRLIIDNTGNVTISPTLTINPPTPGTISLKVFGVSAFDVPAGVTGTDFTVCGKLDTGSTLHAILVKCGVSSIRYKNNVNDLPSALELLRRLRPVSFNWKADNSPDVGFIAEEVADVEPQLVIYNPDKQVEGVRYDKLGIFLVKAAQEQQTQIETQQKQIDEQAELIKQQQERLDKQNSEIEALKAIVCANNQTAEICREKKP